MILKELTSSGITIQLKFLEEEGSRDLVRSDLHAGFVLLCQNRCPSFLMYLGCRVLQDGKEIAFHQDMQHNRNYSSLPQNSAAIVSAVKAALGKA
jgi:hypothetical protein